MIFFKDAQQHDRILTKVNHFINTACDIVHVSVHTGIPTHLLLAVKSKKNQYFVLSTAHILLIYLYYTIPANYVSHHATDKVFKKFALSLDRSFLFDDTTINYQAIVQDLLDHHPYLATHLISAHQKQELALCLDSLSQRKLLGYALRTLLEQYAHFATHGTFYSKQVSYIARHLPIVVTVNHGICQHLHDEMMALSKTLNDKNAKTVAETFRKKHPVMPVDDLIKIFQDVNTLPNSPKKRYYFALTHYLLEHDLHPYYQRVERGVLPTDRQAESFVSKLSLAEKYACIGVYTNSDKAVSSLNEFLCLAFNMHPLYRLIERESRPW